VESDSLSRLRAAIEEAARRGPDRIALDDGAESRSYDELAERLAAAAGTDDGGRRALAVQSSVADVESVLTATFAGASLLLLDAKTTARERERAEALFVEATEGAAGGLVLGLCSSGSSGLPKVVELDWESLLGNAASFADAAGYRPDDVLWCTTPLAHLYAFGAGVVGGLLSGATVILGKGMLEPAEFAQLASERRPTLLLSVPFLLRRYLKILEADPEIARGWSLRSAVAAGEPVPGELVSAWRQAAGVPLRSHYGLTEGGQITLAAGEGEEGVGRPIDGVEVRIGEGGEIAVRRPPPARPYRIVGHEPGPDGWYATGDLGHLDEAGNLHVTGRADARINVAGKKVDPAEVEAALLECEGVEDCTVAAVEAAGEIEIVAFLQVGEAAPGDGAIRAELARGLSPHKLPRRFVRVAEIPRTLTGKVRRGQLISELGAAEAGADWGAAGAEAGGVDPDLLETVRAQAAAVVLGHASAAEIDGELTFKELGFDSLAVVALCERLTAATGEEVSPTAAFDHPSPQALAAHLGARAGGAVSPMPAVRSSRFSAEPIAIVGIGCRYPGGVGSAEELWSLVAGGADAIEPFPGDRGWDLERLYDPDPDSRGTSYVREGGFLAGATEFDAEFFGIGPREALAMDPQQRLLLEVAWEAFEDAGLDPSSLAGSRAGVFAGLMSQDYGAAAGASGSSEGYRTTGLAESVVSGRISFSLGLEGPAVTVNTACSSSLVAAHLAAQALRLDECDLAVAGGVTVMATPTEFVEFSRQRGLAPDGRCKAFAATADGTGFSEGVGLLVLERLADAQARGRRIYATIRGSAINQDGASNGLTAPNGPSQERVIRQALANAGLSPSDVDAVEAHGTGTALGDPIEAGALLAIYGQDREEPLRLGSVKSNIGHTQAAAGVAGVIKMAMAMREGVLPRTLHVEEPSPHVDWSAGKVELLSEPQGWEEGERPRRAGVSSFGISGTNAHLILEEAPEPEPPVGEVVAEVPEVPLPGLVALPLSAKSEGALRQMAAGLAARMAADPDLDPRDVGFSLATTRALLERRAVVVCAGRREAIEGLEGLAAGEPSAFAVDGSAHGGKLALLFTGQGAQRAGMGRDLYEASQPFARALDEACEALDPHLDRGLKDLLFAEEGSSEAALLDHTACTQPALFALEVGLFRAVEALGLIPDYLAGHSIGELSAAHVAGVLSLEDAAKLVSARGRLMGALPPGGAMIAIEATEEEVAQAIEGTGEELAIAAVNGPRSVVVSGAEAAALAIESHFEEQGARTKRLAVSHAFHSPLIEPMLDEFAEVAESVEYRPPRIPIVSDVSGELLGTDEAIDPQYWVAHARRAVRFADVVSTLEREGVGACLELGPDGVLTAMAASCLGDGGAEPAPIATLRPDRPEPESLLLGLAAAHVAGARVGWEALHPGARRVPLPTYPFQRRRYWLAAGSGSGDAASLGQRPLEHPLLAAVVEDAGGERLTLTGVVSAAAQPWIEEHDLLEARLLPSSALLELALVAAEEAGCDVVEELVLQAPVLLPEDGGLSVQVDVGERDERGSRPFSIHTRSASEDAEWTQHGSGALAGADPGAAAPDWQLEEADAEVQIEEELREQAPRFLLHPALLEAALEAAGEAAGLDEEAAPTWVTQWKGVRVLTVGASSLRAQLSPAGDASSADEEGLRLLASDRSGTPVIAVDSLRRGPLKLEQLGAEARRSMYRLDWEELALPEADGEPGTVLVDSRPWAGGEAIEASHAVAARALERVQGHLNDSEAAGTRLVFLTEGALQTGLDDEPSLPASALAGLIRSACSEHPGRFALVDTDAAGASEATLAGAVAAATREPQIALRGGRALAPRVARAEEIEPAAEVLLFDPERTVLITGGTGGLGALLAEHLVPVHGVRHLLLLSRSGAGAEGADELRARLETQGAEVAIEACDVSDREDLARAIAAVSAEHPLGAVLHAAAVVDNGLVADLGGDELDRVMAPKLDAAWHLHELTADLDLSAFVLFSSAAGLLGGPGQGNYAAANAFLDALAFLRRRQGLPATSLAWGLWDRQSNLGGRATEAEREQLVRQTRALLGFAPLPSERGLELFDAAAAFAGPLLAPVSFDRAALRAQARSGSLPAPMRGMVRVPERRQHGGDQLGERLAALPQSEREPVAIEFVRTHVAAVLGHESAAAVDPDRAFKDLGFDSLATVELRNRLVAATGVQLAATRAFDYPSTAALARFLLAEVGAGPGAGRTAVVRARDSEEPIAIVGIGCRYPGGVGSPEELWSLVAGGADAIEPFPGDRGWDLERLYDPDPDNRGTSYVREAGFLAGATEFDAEFFGIGPREALAMDPQQRLLLEVAWDAFEDAGLDPASLRGSETGVFAGIATSDYAALPRSRPELEGHIGTGNVGSVVSGRVAYSFDLAGPAITVDTACSSSLVAAHLACDSLRGGGCSLALAGGVTVLATPETYVEFSRQRGLAPDGRCKAFAATADGTSFSEGVGLLVLERLADAQAKGRRIYATIRGSAINQDGASNGLTAPNGPSQERVIRQALANAGISPSDVDAVEAHGTGTALGDPIEAGALLATYGQEREEPLRLGSVKSNIGHTQAAAGVAGVIKMAMAMREGVLPQTLHVEEPSPHVDWSAGQVELLSEPRSWEEGERPRRASVSSFGISGTNAHLILEQAPEVDVEREGGPDGRGGGREPVAARAHVPWPLSAKGERALRDRAGSLLAHLREHPDLDPPAVGFSLAARSQLSHRAVLLGEGREQLLAGLERLATGELGVAEPRAGATAFLFTGQGAQRPGMGRELHAAFPVFAEALEAACAELDPDLDRPLLDLLFAEEGSAEAALLDRTQFTQPGLFAVEVALYRLLESWGLRPDFLAGHSIGELSAAHAAGILALPDAARLVAARGRLMGGLEEGGAMVAIGAGEAEVAEYLADAEGLSIAAVNDPGSVVVSGEEEAALRAAAAFRERGRKVSRLRVSHAFHSHRMEPILDELVAVARELEFSDPRIPVVSDVTGELLDAEQAASPEYWARQAREPVRFLDAVRTLADRGVARFLELGPDAVLSAMVDDCLEGEQRVQALASMRDERPEVETLLGALSDAHATGFDVHWPSLFEGPGAARVALPPYPFQRRRHWLEPSAGAGDLAAAGLADAAHPLLGAAVPLAGEEDRRVFTGSLSLDTAPWLAEHSVAGAVLLPGAACAELALAIGRELDAELLEEMIAEAPLVVPASGAVQVQLAVGEAGERGERSFSLHSRPGGEGSEWARNASGVLAPSLATAASEPTAWPPEGAQPLDVGALYDELLDEGFQYGPFFQGLRAAWRRGEEVFAEVHLDPGLREEGARYAIHPALLDCALHAGFLADPDGGPRLPFSWSGVWLGAGPFESLRVRVRPSGEGSFAVSASDPGGAAALRIEELAMRPLEAASLGAGRLRPNSLFALRWREAAVPEAPAEAGVELLRYGPAAGSDAALAAREQTEELLAELQSRLGAEEGDGEEVKRIALVTRGAIAARPGEGADLASAPLWGLMRSAQAEHPGRFVLVDSDDSDASGRVLGRALSLALEEGEPQLAIRDGRALVGRLEGVDSPERPAAADSEATILITGATGALGSRLARHLVEVQGARNLLLLSRRGPEAEGAEALLAELREMGAEVRLVACDVAEREQLAELIESIPATHPLDTVVHAAGTIDDGLLADLTPDRLQTVFRAKVDGAWNLHELTAGRALERFVLFSAFAGVLGSPAQANYAAANAFCDALAAQRASEGLPGTAIAWGLWASEGGMTAHLGDADRARMRRTGFVALGDDDGLALFDAALAAADSQLLAAPLDVPALRAQARAGALAAPLRGLVPAPAAQRSQGGSLSRRLAVAAEKEREAIVLAAVREETAAVLGHDSAKAVDPERPFKDLGFDSLAAVELRNRLGLASQSRLPSTVVFDYPNPAALARFLLERVRGDDPRPVIGAELDDLESRLALVDEDERMSALVRLRSILARLSLQSDSDNGEDEFHRDLDAASDEEMIQLIEEEFGSV
jgi:acyl transferase domain-containing protein/acyl-coenzyme A synthetase/AMP-(fatty) acid ligase/acyl carrier protein